MGSLKVTNLSGSGTRLERNLSTVRKRKGLLKHCLVLTSTVNPTLTAPEKKMVFDGGGG